MPPSNAPETTRQRMIGLLYIMLLCMLALNVSSDVLGGFELVEDSLLKSTHNSSIQNKSLYDDLYASYLQNPEKAGNGTNVLRKSNSLPTRCTITWKKSNGKLCAKPTGKSRHSQCNQTRRR